MALGLLSEFGRGGIFAPIYLLLLPDIDPKGGQKKFGTRFREKDYGGALVSIGTLVSSIMAIDFGGTLYAWNSARVIASFVVAAFALLRPRCSSCLASQRLSRSDFFQYNSSRTKKPCSSSYSVQHRTRGFILNLFMYRYSSIY